MLRSISKISALSLLILLLTEGSHAQYGIKVDKKYVDSFDFRKYKTFLVSKDYEIHFIGKTILPDKRFTPDSSQMVATELAMRTQYYKATARRLDSLTLATNNHFGDTTDHNSVRDDNEYISKSLESFKRKQLKDLAKYDRYMFGYYDNINEPIILILFDPHKIKYYTISGESFIVNLPLLYYNSKTQILSQSVFD